VSGVPAALAAIKARIEAQPTPLWPQGVAVHLGAAPDGAVVPYVCLWDQTDSQVRGKATGSVQRSRLPFQLSCVTRDRASIYAAMTVARSVLDWAPVDGSSRIVEDGSNPLITEGSGSDVRYTAPLTMHCYLP
jgi:hypothetical protein